MYYIYVIKSTHFKAQLGSCDGVIHHHSKGTEQVHKTQTATHTTLLWTACSHWASLSDFFTGFWMLKFKPLLAVKELLHTSLSDFLQTERSTKNIKPLKETMVSKERKSDHTWHWKSLLQMGKNHALLVFTMTPNQAMARQSLKHKNQWKKPLYLLYPVSRLQIRVVSSTDSSHGSWLSK